ncbi:MAG TPA: Na(+)-translocating NADH-quinone reductase subunit C [Pseudomonadales bacterium]|jgi:Na+-transporting NADH:ubiquinone oxidoreductase subunit C
MSSNKETVSRTLLVAFLVCIVCSVLVAAAVVLLKDDQLKNKQLDRQRNILAAAGLYDGSQSNSEVASLFARFEVLFVNMKTGLPATPEELEAAGINVDRYDQRKAARDPSLSRQLTAEQDIASIKRQAQFSQVYVLRENGKIVSVVLPVHGYGLWSTLYGYLAMDSDGTTVKGLGFYEHGETPGLGGEVDNPKWKALWPGKQVYNADGEPALHVIKGKVDPASADAVHAVDGLSGASLTSNGVSNLIHFWTGEMGYQAFLAHVREGAM